jgi:hypothetical protein
VSKTQPFENDTKQEKQTYLKFPKIYQDLQSHWHLWVHWLVTYRSSPYFKRVGELKSNLIFLFKNCYF